MALTKQYWFLEVALVDRGDKVTTRRYQLVATDTAWDASAVNTAVTTIIGYLNAVTELVVKSYRMGVLFLETALTLPTSGDAEAEQHALVTAQILGVPNKSAVIDIPGPVIGVFMGSSGEAADIVDVTDTDLTNYVKMFDSGEGNLSKISDGEFIDAAIIRGRRTHSKSSQG